MLEYYLLGLLGAFGFQLINQSCISRNSENNHDSSWCQSWLSYYRSSYFHFVQKESWLTNSAIGIRQFLFVFIPVHSCSSRVHSWSSVFIRVHSCGVLDQILQVNKQERKEESK